MSVGGDKYYVNTQKTQWYVSKFYIDVKNIDKNDKNIWRTIYEAIYAPYFEEVKLFSKEFIDHCKNRPNEPQNIPTVINKNIKPP